MNRSLKVERVFLLGQYKTLRLGDTIENIPEELLTNVEFINQIRFLQFIDVERSYRKYLQVRERFDNVSLEDAIAQMDEINLNTVRTIQNIITIGDK